MRGDSVKNECVICGEPLEYLEKDIVMECVICHRKEYSKIRCSHGHYVCNDCHMRGLNQIIGLCMENTSDDPLEILAEMMAQPFSHIQGPEHHVMVGASLLTAYRNAGGEIDLRPALVEMMRRGKSVPGGICGFWGTCGAGIGASTFASIVFGTTPMSDESLKLGFKLNAKIIDEIGELGGPRCCKRSSFISILKGIDFAEEHLGVKMKRSDVNCTFSGPNMACIGERCPFFKKGQE